MNIVSSLTAIFDELKQYVFKNINELKNKHDDNDIDDNNLHIPTMKWTIFNSCIILKSHPRGISRAVLLTELESRWRKSLKRGEHGGRLAQCVATKELSLSDILEGKLTKLDEFRCNFISEDASVDIILHRQHTDFIAFVKYYFKGVDLATFLTNRKCRITGGRMLLDKSSIILPTPLLVFSLESSSLSDKSFITDVLLPNHKELSTVLHDLSLLSYENMPIKSNNKDFAPDENCPVIKGPTEKVKDAMMLNNKAIGCFVKISMISKTCDHPYTNLSVFRYVRLNVISECSKRPCYIYLILLDDQVNLANLLNLNDTYYIYRPYIALNADESLFKSKEAGHHNVLQYNIVYRDTIALNVLEDGHYPCPCYFLYGATTTLINIDDNENLPFIFTSKNTKPEIIDNSKLQSKLPELLYINIMMIESFSDANDTTNKCKYILWGNILSSTGLKAICEIFVNEDHMKENMSRGQLLLIGLSDIHRISVKLSSVLPSKLTPLMNICHNNEEYTIISGLLQGPLVNLSRILAFSQSPSIMLPQNFSSTVGTFFVLASPVNLTYPLSQDLTAIVQMQDCDGNIADCLFSSQMTNLSCNCFISDKIQFTADIKFAILITCTDQSFLVECISDNNEIALNLYKKRLRNS